MSHHHHHHHRIQRMPILFLWILILTGTTAFITPFVNHHQHHRTSFEINSSISSSSSSFHKQNNNNQTNKYNHHHHHHHPITTTDHYNVNHHPNTNKKNKNSLTDKHPNKNDNHNSSQRKKSSFEHRMRSLLNKDRIRGNKLREALPSNVCVVDTLKEYKKHVGSCQGNQIVCVRFFAPWCKACKAIQPHFYRLSREYPNVKFIEVPVTEKNTDLHQGLGVPSLPYGHIYVPEAGLVEELRISRKFFPQLKMALHSYVYGSCDLPDGDTKNPFVSQAE